MSFVDKNLMPGEKVLYRGRLHWNVYVKPLVVLVLAMGVAVVIPHGGAWVVGGLGFPIVLWLLAAHVQRTAAEFAITSRRLIVKHGVIRQNSYENMLSKVEGIEVRQGILDRMLGCGTLVFTGTGGHRVPLGNIAAPLEFRRHAQMAIESLDRDRASGASGERATA